MAGAWVAWVDVAGCGASLAAATGAGLQSGQPRCEAGRQRTGGGAMALMAEAMEMTGKAGSDDDDCVERGHSAGGVWREQEAARRQQATKKQCLHSASTRSLRAARKKVRYKTARTGDSGAIKGSGGSDMVRLTNPAGPQTSGEP